MSGHAPQSPEEDIAEGTIIGDHFLVTRKLGEGGMGQVFLAENVELPDKRYAIKILRKELSAIRHYEQLLKQEAQKQARLDHENIVQLYDVFRWRQRYCLVLAFVDGTTVADLIAAAPGGLPEARALDLMLDVLKGMNHAHEHGVLHCDIKPANVLVDVDNRVRVTDFGIARDVGTTAAGEQGVRGTPEYMSPEQIDAPENIDHRTDVYSLGVLLFEMLTGRLPFAYEGESSEVRFPQLTVEPADIRNYRKDLKPHLCRIVATALQRNPAARFQGCMDFYQAIVDYRKKERWKRTWLPAIVVVSLLVLAAVIANYQWQQTLQARAREERQQNEKIARAAALANDARARETIQVSIATAITQLGSLCREAIRLEQRRATLATASGAGFQDLVAKFQKQIDDIKKNISDTSGKYSDQVGQLAKFDTRLVDERLKAYPPQDPESARFLQAVRSDYAALSEQRQVRDARELLATCPK